MHLRDFQSTYRVKLAFCYRLFGCASGPSEEIKTSCGEEELSRRSQKRERRRREKRDPDRTPITVTLLKCVRPYRAARFGIPE